MLPEPGLGGGDGGPVRLHSALGCTKTQSDYAKLLGITDTTT